MRPFGATDGITDLGNRYADFELVPRPDSQNYRQIIALDTDRRR
jgi:hypothetical protein